MSRKFIIGVLAAGFILGGSTPAFALEQEKELEDSRTHTRRAVTPVEKTVQSADDTVKTDDTAADNLQTQRTHIEDRKAALRDELKQKRQEIKQKLAGRRLAQCQNREQVIKKLLDKSADKGRERLTQIQRFEEHVRAFYAKKNLSSDQYAAASQNVDDKEAAAIAAIDVTAAEPFDCANLDGVTPSATIKATREAKRTALNQYRDSVKGLIKVVSAAIVSSHNTESAEPQS